MLRKVSENRHPTKKSANKKPAGTRRREGKENIRLNRSILQVRLRTNVPDPVLPSLLVLVHFPASDFPSARM